MSDKKKSLFDKAIDALTDRDEKEEAAEKAQAQALAAQKEAEALRARMEAQKAAAAKAAAEKDAAEKAAVARAAAEKAAAERSAALKAAAERAAAERAAAAPKKGIVTIRSLRVRKDHSTSSEVVAGLVDGNEVIILETWSDGKNTWGRLEKGWAAMVYEGETYIKVA